MVYSGIADVTAAEILNEVFLGDDQLSEASVDAAQ